MTDSREGFIRGKPGEMFGLPVKIDLKGTRCQEASSMSATRYIPCGDDATKLVLSDRGTRLYFMCEPCADHNVRNRGAILVATHQEINI